MNKFSSLDECAYCEYQVQPQKGVVHFETPLLQAGETGYANMVVFCSNECKEKGLANEEKQDTMQKSATFNISTNQATPQNIIDSLQELVLDAKRTHQELIQSQLELVEHVKSNTRQGLSIAHLLDDDEDIGFEDDFITEEFPTNKEPEPETIAEQPVEELPTTLPSVEGQEEA